MSLTAVAPTEPIIDADSTQWTKFRSQYEELVRRLAAEQAAALYDIATSGAHASGTLDQMLAERFSTKVPANATPFNPTNVYMFKKTEKDGKPTVVPDTRMTEWDRTRGLLPDRRVMTSYSIYWRDQSSPVEVDNYLNLRLVHDGTYMLINHTPFPDSAFAMILFERPTPLQGHGHGKNCGAMPNFSSLDAATIQSSYSYLTGIIAPNYWQVHEFLSRFKGLEDYRRGRAESAISGPCLKDDQGYLVPRLQKEIESSGSLIADQQATIDGLKAQLTELQSQVNRGRLREVTTQLIDICDDAVSAQVCAGLILNAAGNSVDERTGDVQKHLRAQNIVIDDIQLKAVVSKVYAVRGPELKRQLKVEQPIKTTFTGVWVSPKNGHIHLQQTGDSVTGHYAGTSVVSPGLDQISGKVSTVNGRVTMVFSYGNSRFKPESTVTLSANGDTFSSEDETWFASRI